MANDDGRLYVGTSGFSYPGWVPRFYEPGKASRKLLAAYATRLPAVELHSTFFRRPNEQQIAKWMRETDPAFRFCPKAQRATSWRAFSEPDPRASIRWLTDALEGFGDRLGSVLLSLRASLERDDAALERALSAWPRTVPLGLELLHPTWHQREVRDRARDHGVTLVATDLEGREPPELHDGGGFVYVRLRREAYAAADLDRWARRLEPVLAAGSDAFVFFRHDDDGQMALNAEALLDVLRPFTRR
ncbi:MAG: DUF72 domain-containing protein [Candidatus Limnocylindrales bacterium]